MRDSSLHVFVVVACLALSSRTSAGEIQVTLKPNKPVYVLGEPLVCDFVVKNASPDEMGIALSYPRLMGLSFAGQKPSIPELGVGEGGSMSLIKIQANQEYRVRIALNRYLPILRVGQYRLPYETMHVVMMMSAREQSAFGRAFQEGFVQFGVVAGVLSEDMLKSFADGLDQKDSHKVREAIEMLIWIDDPRAVTLLKKGSAITFAKDAAIELVRARWTLLYGLAKFLHLEEARSIFFDIASQSDGEDMTEAYRICMDRSLPVPEAIVKGGLGSDDGSKKYSSLEYLLACGTPAQAEWVVPLTKDENPNIRALAEKVLAKFKEDAEKKKGK
jgi:hypothetical protein